MNDAQELLKSMALENTRLALAQLELGQFGLAMTSLKTAQMNLEHWQAASGQGAARRAIGNKPKPLTIEV